MDAEGYIPISLIASFYRVQALSQDQDLILQVCITFKLLYQYPTISSCPFTVLTCRILCYYSMLLRLLVLSFHSQKYFILFIGFRRQIFKKTLPNRNTLVAPLAVGVVYIQHALAMAFTFK